MSDTITCDVIVVGAGIAGAGAAFWLAANGHDTVIVERENPASGPTGTSSAISHLFYMEPELSQLARRGCQILKDIPELTGGPKVFHETGMLWGVGEAAAPLWSQTVARIRDKEGGGIDTIGLDELARMAPNFELHDLTMGVWEDRYGYGDPYESANELVRGARTRGARYFGNRSVAAIGTAGGKVTGVTLSDGTKISAPRVILACGPWTKALVATLGVTLPLRIERHFMAVLDAPGRARNILPFCWCDDTSSHYARPEGQNTILVGTWSGGGTGLRNVETHEKQASHLHDVKVAGEFDASVSTDESVWTIEHMIPRCPEIAELGLRPGYACMYDMSPDDLPVIDQVPGVEGLLFAAGSSGHGFKLGPAVGENIAMWATGTRPALLAPFGLSRFG